MKELEIKLIQECPNCHQNTLEFWHWHIGPKANRLMAYFGCNNHVFCGQKYYKIIDKTINELIVKGGEQ